MVVQRLRRHRGDQQLGGLAVRSAPPRADRRRARQRHRHRQRDRGSIARSATADPDCERLVFRIRAQHHGAVLSATDEDLDKLSGPWRPKPTMNPIVAANSDSMQHSTRSTTQPPTAGEPMALPDLDIARVQRWCAARVPEHARHQVHVECQIPRDTSPSSSGALPGARTSARSRPLPDRSAAIHHRRELWTLYWRDRNLRFHVSTYSHPRTESSTCSTSSTATPPASSGADPTSQGPMQLSWGQPAPSRWGQVGDIATQDCAAPRRSQPNPGRRSIPPAALGLRRGRRSPCRRRRQPP